MKAFISTLYPNSKIIVTGVRKNSSYPLRLELSFICWLVPSSELSWWRLVVFLCLAPVDESTYLLAGCSDALVPTVGFLTMSVLTICPETPSKNRSTDLFAFPYFLLWDGLIDSSNLHWLPHPCPEMRPLETLDWQPVGISASGALALLQFFQTSINSSNNTGLSNEARDPCHTNSSQVSSLNPTPNWMTSAISFHPPSRANYLKSEMNKLTFLLLCLSFQISQLNVISEWECWKCF